MDSALKDQESSKDSTQAIIAILCAALLVTIMGMLVKTLTKDLPAIEVTFSRNFFGLLWILGDLILRPPKQQIGGRPFVLFLRGFAGGSAMLAYFYNISIMPLGTAYAFSYTSPIFLALFSVIFIHERVAFKTWIAIFMGFCGILLISNPNTINLSFFGVLIGLYSGIGAALAYLSIQKLATLYDPRTIILSLMLSGSILPILTQFVPYEAYPITLFEPFMMPNLKEWFYIFVLGIVSTYAQIYLTKAYSLGDAPIIGALSYITIFMATFAGIFLGDQVPHGFVIIGMLLIVCGGILAVWHKRI